MTKVLVTGPRGLLGSTLMKVLPEAIAFEGDIRDRDAIDDAFYEHKPDWVVHCAAKTNVAWCEKNVSETFEVNTEGCRSLVLAARPTNTKIIYISTCSVFDGVMGNYCETDKPNPIRVYDRSKELGEQHILGYDLGLVLRMNLIGIHPDTPRVKNFMEWLVDAYKANRNVALFEDVFINPLSNWTAAKVIGQIISQNIKDRILHIGSLDWWNKAEIGRTIANKFPEYGGHITREPSRQRLNRMTLAVHKAHFSVARMPMLEKELGEIFDHEHRLCNSGP